MSMIYDVRHSQFSARVAYVMFFHAANRPMHRTPVSTSNNRDQSDHRSCTPISAIFNRTIANVNILFFKLKEFGEKFQKFSAFSLLRWNKSIESVSFIQLSIDGFNCRSKTKKIDERRERKKKNKESIDTDDRAWPRFCFRLYSKGGKGEFSQGKAELNVTGSEQTFAIHARYLPHHLVDYL